MNTVPAPQRVVGIYFNDGCVLSKDRIYVSGKLKGVDPDDVTFSRLCVYNARSPLAGGQPRWGYGDRPGLDVVSVCLFAGHEAETAEKSTGGLSVALSTQGHVSLVGRGVAQQAEKITDVERIGAASQVCQIGDRLYVCGMQGQVYRRDSAGWVHIDQGVLAPNTSPDTLHLNSIDGTSDRDIYVCGFGGRILHFDGARWDELVSPTNVHLERVHCVSPSEVYFCGNRGTFLKLANGVFTDHSIAIDDHFWGLTSFQDKIYLATLKGLYVFDGSQVVAVNTKLKPAIGGYRLDARDGQLWSFGVDDLAWFDGTKWTRLKHPDNP